MKEDNIVGFKNGKIIRKVRDTSFKGIDLNEDVVQNLFKFCLETPNSKEITSSNIYLMSLGYEKMDRGVSFDKNKLLANEAKIKYLYGQLQPIHQNQHVITEKDFSKKYTGDIWSSSKSAIMLLIYLGTSDDLRLLNSFIAQRGGTTLRAPLTPTLSPKDPNFPAWWEEHKAEWEAEE